MNRSRLKVWVLLSSSVSVWLCAAPIAAQVVPDNTLPAEERSQVTGNPNAQIDGGAVRGSNLFHSFSEFSIPTGGSAYFNNAADVRNIFSRITGGSVSNINGVIRANGTANLFLLNPNGILFGPNASLNIGGSFVATTADAIGFPTGEVFSSDATQPLPSQLLTVNPDALFFNQLNPQPIVVQSRFDERLLNRSSFNGTGLHVPPGQNLLLVGGPIQLESGEPFIPTSLPGQPILFFYYRGIEYVQPDGGWLVSPGSHVELGAVDGIGRVGLSTASPDWQLTIPDGVPRADISFSQGSGIDARGASGSIRLLAQNIDISRSLLQIGIPSDLRLPDTQTGDIDLNATGSITLRRSRLDNRLFGEGTIGSINLSAGDRVSLDNASVLNFVERTGIGNAGDINITTGSLSLTTLAGLASYTYGRGNAGNVNINARDRVSLDDYGLIQNMVRTTGIGNAGDINITTGSLSLTNDAQLDSITLGQGNAGSININARDTVSLRGESALISRTAEQGNAGSININAYNTISLDDSSVNSYVSFDGIGNSGGINITTGSLSLINTAQLNSRTYGQGNAGSVNINARDRVSLDGSSPIPGTYPSSIYTQVESTGIGQGGNVRITTGSLSLTNGGVVNTATEGRGDAGRVIIDARDIQISGTAPGYTIYLGEVANNLSELVPVDLPSGVTTSVRSRAVGNGGDVIITTGSLSVSDFGAINTNAQGRGNAGNIQIRASDAVSFDSADAISTLDSGAVGRGGDIDITARSLSVLNNARLSASTAGKGPAGNITVSADTIGLSSGGQLLTTTNSNSRAGNITVNTPELQLSGATSGLFTETTSAGNAGDLTIQPGSNRQNLRVNLQDGAQISASTRSRGDGGDLAITAPESITLTGSGSVIAAETGGGGTGGNLMLRTGNLRIQNAAQVTVSSSTTGSAGSLFVDADRVYLNKGGRIRADTSGGGGNINVRSPLILLRNGSNITTNATGSNIPGGSIAVDTQFLIAVPNEDSNISANSEDFRGGNVSVNAVSIYGIQARLNPTPLSDITATGATSSLNGTIDLITAGIDLTSGLVQLPTQLVDPTLMAQGCPANKGNSFVISGRGGLPPTPEQQLDDDADWQDRRRLTVEQTQNGSGRSQQADVRRRQEDTETRRPGGFFDSKAPGTPPTSKTLIVEATGWQMTSTGKVFLIATTAASGVQNPLNQPAICQKR